MKNYKSRTRGKSNTHAKQNKLSIKIIKLNQKLKISNTGNTIHCDPFIYVFICRKRNRFFHITTSKGCFSKRMEFWSFSWLVCLLWAKCFVAITKNRNDGRERQWFLNNNKKDIQHLEHLDKSMEWNPPYSRTYFFMVYLYITPIS